jgi:hypothetical protein
MKVKLNQIIAVEKGTKERVHQAYTKAHQGLAKPEPLTGIGRTYQPLSEEGEQLPPENKYVQASVTSALDEIQKLLTDLFDVTFTKDVGNAQAKADIKVGDTVLLKDVPSTYLLFLEKQLADLRTVIAALPRLDPAQKWIWDEQQGFFKSEPIRTARTKKVTEFVIAAPATDKHPAQVKEVTNDVLAGYWTTVHYSGALEPTRIAELAERTQTVLDAVKFAREAANMTEVEQLKAAKPIFDYIFAP